MIYVNHGIGGRAASYSDKYLGFDFVLVAGAADEQRLLEDRRVRPGHYAVIGYPKFEAARRLADRPPDCSKMTVRRSCSTRTPSARCGRGSGLRCR